MAGKPGRPGAAKGGKGPTKGSGGKNKRSLEGRGPTPKAEDRAWHPAGKRSQHRGADGHPQGIEADQEACRGERDIELLGDGGDEPHDHEFGGAYGKGT